MLLRWLTLAVLLLLSPMPSWSATYYVSTSGSNSNSCATAQSTTLSNAKQTIAAGIGCLTAGDTLYLRSGTYAEAIRTSTTGVPSGGSWATPITIAGFPGETVTLLGDGAVGIDISTGANVQYVIFNQLILDVSSNSNAPGVYVGGGSHHIRFSGLEIKNAFSGTGNVVTAALGIQGGANNVEVLGCHIHGFQGYGMYVTGQNWVIDGNNVHNNAGYGIQVYRSGGNDVNNNIVRNNYIHHNGGSFSVSTWGLIMASGTGNIAYNNIIYANGGGLQTDYSATNTAFYNNTIYSNAGEGITIGAGASGTLVKNNIVYGNSGQAIANSGSGTVQTTNLTTDPRFVNAGGGDFTVQANSAARNAGTSLASIFTTAYDGTARPQGGAWDIGAYEYLEGGGVPANGNTIYVAKTGSDSNDCIAAESLSTPKLTLASACSCMTAPGKRLEIRTGTYIESLKTLTCPLTGGTTPAAPTVIARFASEVVTLQLPSGQTGGVIALEQGANDQFLTFDGLILNGNSVTFSTGLVVYPGAHDIVFQNGEVKNTYWESAYIYSAANVTLRNTLLHDSTHEHGVHVVGTSDNIMLDQLTVSAFVGCGVRIDGNDAPTGVLTNVTLRASSIHHGSDGVSPGVCVGASTGTTALNNLIWLNGAGLRLYSGAVGTKVYHNSIANNTGLGLQVDAGGSGGILTNNISFGNGTNAILNNGSATLTTNLTTTPLWTNAAAGVLTTQAGSAAINTGTTLAGVTTDYAGTTRPQGAQYDIGAYETTQVTPPQPPGPDVTVQPRNIAQTQMFF